MKLRLAVLILVCSVGLWGHAEDDALPVGKILKSAGVELDVKNHEVRIDATICLDEGILEYIACLPDTFEHESVFCIRCRPSILHLSLLAIGLEPCPLDVMGAWRAKARKQAKQRLNIEVEYEEDGKKLRRNISEFLVNRKDPDVAVPGEWIFTGSFFVREGERRVYAADAAGGVIGLGLEEASVIQFGEEMGNPYDNDDEGLEIRTDEVPATGTKVKLIFSPAKEKAPENGKPQAQEEAQGEGKAQSGEKAQTEEEPQDEQLPEGSANVPEEEGQP